MSRRRWRQWLAAVMFLISIGAMLGACRPTEKELPSKPLGVVKQYGSAPLTLALRLDRERLTVAERLTVELRAETDEEYAVKFTEVKAFTGFAVASASESKPELMAPGRIAVSFHYVLEPLAAGSVQIPVLTVEVWKKAEANAAITTVVTEPVQVTIDSLLANDDSGATISDIAPPLAKPLNPWLLAGLGLAGVVVLALIITLVRRRLRRLTPPPPPLPPHLLAYQALDRLLATDLLATSQIKAFYETLSDILRHYIEQRFGLRASEQTTEEFLAVVRLRSPTVVRSFGFAQDELRSPTVVRSFGSAQDELRSPTADASDLIDSRHQLLLRDFLSHCDLVKFARHTPARSEAEESVERCRRFVRETEPVENLEKQGGKA